MKKNVIVLLMCAAVLLTVGCKKDNIRPVTSTHIMLDALKVDYKKVISSYPSTLDKLVEARCTLDHKITEVSSVKDLNVVNMSEVYYIGYFSDEHCSKIVYVDRNFEDGTTQMNYVEPQSPWLGDHSIPMATLDSMITLEQACWTSGRIWLEKITVCSLRRLRISSRISTVCFGSRPAVGSSKTRISGAPHRAWAIPARCL